MALSMNLFVSKTFSNFCFWSMLYSYKEKVYDLTIEMTWRQYASFICGYNSHAF